MSAHARDGEGDERPIHADPAAAPGDDGVTALWEASHGLVMEVHRLMEILPEDHEAQEEMLDCFLLAGRASAALAAGAQLDPPEGGPPPDADAEGRNSWELSLALHQRALGNMGDCLHVLADRVQRPDARFRRAFEIAGGLREDLLVEVYRRMSPRD